MTGPRTVEAFLRGLEAAIDSGVGGRERVSLAFSGGLGSMLVAMVARKRCDLRCLVVGVEGAPDLDAARMAKTHFDYRVEPVLLDGRETRKLDADLAAAHPGLTVKERRQLIPIRAVLSRTREGPILAGFSRTPPGGETAETLERDAVRLPLIAANGARTVPRERLRVAAISLGLPEEWAQVKHRAPTVGAGIDAFLLPPKPVRR